MGKSNQGRRSWEGEGVFAASGGAEVEVESALGALAEEEVAGFVLDEDAGFPAFDAGVRWQQSQSEARCQ
jgi:hypothetical protein